MRPDFRDRQIAASLKRVFELDADTARRADFRDRQIAASLKPVHDNQTRWPHDEFPRSPYRGLIEACKTACRYARGASFPRSPYRGLIEA